MSVFPDKVFDAKRSCLFSELATKSGITSDHHGNPFALSKNGAKDRNRLPRAGRENSDGALVFACEGCVK